MAAIPAFWPSDHPHAIPGMCFSAGGSTVYPTGSVSAGGGRWNGSFADTTGATPGAEVEALCSREARYRAGRLPERHKLSAVELRSTVRAEARTYLAARTEPGVEDVRHVSYCMGVWRPSARARVA